MRILSLLILFVIIFLSNRQGPNSPHGSAFKVSCSTCHSSKGWQLDKKIYSFNHNKTKLPLTGQHNEIDCKLCHPTLVFSEAKTECSQCHNDVHQLTVGLDCSRCHTPASWLVNNITEIHQIAVSLCWEHTEQLIVTSVINQRVWHVSTLLVLIVSIATGRNLWLRQVRSILKQDFQKIVLFVIRLTHFNGPVPDLIIIFLHLCRDIQHPNVLIVIQQDVILMQAPECNSCHHQDYLATTNPNHTCF